MLPPDVSVLVPLFNEAAGVPPLLARLDALAATWPELYEVIAVNDGSYDATGALLNAAAAYRPWLRVLHHPANQGLGAALATGITAAHGAILCVIDSDCTYPPERLPEFTARIRAGADLVTASPWHPGGGSDAPWFRVLLSRAVSLLWRALTGARIFTFSAMFRAYHRDKLAQLHPQSPGFAAVTEILLLALRRGYRVEEIPLPLSARQQGESKMRIAKAMRGHLQLMFRWITHRL